jgi:hypothetical protein
MNIGSLYKVKKYFWLLFPTKETAAEAAAHAATTAAAVAATASTAAWYSKRYKRYNCEVTYFSFDSIVVFLEEDGVFKKILTSDGLVGWIWWFDESCKDCFEEVKSE